MATRIARPQDIVAALAARGGLARAADLMAALGISQATLSRRVRDAGETVLALGRGRATRYALARAVRGGASRFPVYRVGPDGRVSRHGELLTLHGGRCLLRMAEGGELLHDGLPWFIEDMRPQGFLGRLFARQAAPLGVPADPREWTGDDALLALSQRGEDCVGNLILGEGSLARYLDRAARPPVTITEQDYPALAAATLAGEMPGSSAGGEQPKFACAVAGQAPPRHLIVKFSPPVASGGAARRWADLLVCECLALATLRGGGWPAAASRLVEAGGRLLLEVERFDRTARGRIGIVSGAAVEAEFVGGATTWSRLGVALAAAGRLSQTDAESLAALELFGGMIGNSDMHLGNVSFFTEGRFALAPCYDMLPMRYAPVGRGEVLPDIAAPAIPAFSHETRNLWLAAADLAGAFWRGVKPDARLGGRFDAIADAALSALAEAKARCELLA